MSTSHASDQGWVGGCSLNLWTRGPPYMHYVIFPTQRVRGDWVSTESTVHSCLKSQANKTPLVEGPEAEWIQQTFSFKETGPEVRMHAWICPFFNSKWRRKKFAVSGFQDVSCRVLHFQPWVILSFGFVWYICISFMFVKRTRTRNAISAISPKVMILYR